MRLTILGCSGAIAGSAMKTTALLIDEDVLIDAGTGMFELSLAQLEKIDHLYLTHSHIDHVAGLPLLIDAVGETRHGRPIVVHALPETLAALREHIFNGVIWPDFTAIPTPAAPWVVLEPLAAGADIDLGGGRRLRVLPAVHSVPAVGYAAYAAGGSVVFSGDTLFNPELWPALADLPPAAAVILEVAFPDEEADLADKAGHFCPQTLAQQLACRPQRFPLWITHLKPRFADRIMQQVAAALPDWTPCRLSDGQVFEL